MLKITTLTLLFTAIPAVDTASCAQRAVHVARRINAAKMHGVHGASLDMVL
jgi:hypothetical protein